MRKGKVRQRTRVLGAAKMKKRAREKKNIAAKGKQPACKAYK